MINVSIFFKYSYMHSYIIFINFIIVVREEQLIYQVFVRWIYEI